MKKLYYILPILLFAFVVQACKSSKEAMDPKDSVSEAPTEATEVATEESPVVTNDDTERTLFASIERTPCFGRCPTYTLKIYSDGFVEFDGIRDVDMLGKYTTSITQEQMDAILEQANDIAFFSFEDEYDDGMITDLPSTTTTVVKDGKTKSVMRRHGYPKRLLLLENSIEALIKSERWTSETGEIYPPER
ncbi:MAG: hypothetical protein Crog4KO_29470 [Crocinitomicaceae bacterium]